MFKYVLVLFFPVPNRGKGERRRSFCAVLPLLKRQLSRCNLQSVSNIYNFSEAPFKMQHASVSNIYNFSSVYPHDVLSYLCLSNN